MASLKKRLSHNLSPVKTIALSFAGMILVGALLLSTPFAAKGDAPVHFLDALFTATSATCVTGLVVFDTFQTFNLFGQCVILALIQCGGIGFITFTMFFNIVIGRRLGLRGMKLAQESVGEMYIFEIQKTIKLVLAVVFTIEGIGALLLAIRFVPQHGLYGAFMAIFTSISAFCNAGFDVMGAEGAFVNLTGYYNDYLVSGVVMCLIVAGGLGFLVWRDLLYYHRTKKFMLHTVVVLKFTLVMILAGAALFLVFEWSNPASIATMSLGDKIVNSLFQSITCRTAGFNTVPLGTLHGITKSLMIVLMFIGAAPASTAGGVKITTVLVIIMTVASVIRGRDDTIIRKRRIPKQVVYRSMAIIVLAVFAVLTTFGIVLWSQNMETSGAIDVAFETVSAFGTVGLSAGLTPNLTAISKLAIILTMFIGRLGPVSFVLALSLKHPSEESDAGTIVPEGKIFVG